MLLLISLVLPFARLQRHGAPDTPPPSAGMERERSCSSIASTGTEAMEVDSPALAAGGVAAQGGGGVRLEVIRGRLQIICEHDEALDASSSPASSL
jgi:hypothetical protein